MAVTISYSERIFHSFGEFQLATVCATACDCGNERVYIYILYIHPYWSVFWVENQSNTQSTFFNFTYVVFFSIFPISFGYFCCSLFGAHAFHQTSLAVGQNISLIRVTNHSIKKNLRYFPPRYGECALCIR